MTTDKTFNISEAAKVSGKSIPTIRAYLDSDKLPNATATTKGKSKTWAIPLTDLVSAGLLDQVKTQDTETTGETAKLKEQLAALRAENDQLKERLTDLQQARADLIAAYAPRIETAQVQSARRRWFSKS